MINNISPLPRKAITAGFFREDMGNASWIANLGAPTIAAGDSVSMVFPVVSVE